MSEVITANGVLADRAAQLAIDGFTLGKEVQLVLAERYIALRAELAEARRLLDEASKQEPVAWMLEWTYDGDEPGRRLYDDERHCLLDANRDGGVCRPLYAAAVNEVPDADRLLSELKAIRDLSVHAGGPVYVLPNNERATLTWAMDVISKIAAPVPAQPAVPDDVAKDAARYRFLRSDGRCDVYVFEHYLSRKELDAAIDAAIISATEGRSNG